MIENLSLSDESLDIQATRYRSFIGRHPNQTNYFQPVLDRLQVSPTRFDIDRSSAIVEGKSDYYTLRYAAKLLGQKDLPLIPALGAGTFGALISLHLGWGIGSVAVLDGDSEGKYHKAKYKEEYGLSANSIVTLSDLVPSLTEIEDLLDDEAREIVKRNLELGKKPSKKQICRFFQEQFARDEIIPLGAGFEDKARALLGALGEALESVKT